MVLGLRSQDYSAWITALGLRCQAGLRSQKV